MTLNNQIWSRLSDKELIKLDSLAATEGRSRSSMIRQLIMEAMDKRIKVEEAVFENGKLRIL